MILISALFAGAAVWILAQRQSRARIRTVMGDRVSDIHGAPDSPSQVSSTHLTAVGFLGGALVGWTFLGIFGALIGAGTALWLLRSWKKREVQPQQKYIDAFTRDSPVMIELLCAALASGATMRDSLAVVRDSMSESPVAGVLARVVSAVDLGADPKEAWSEWINDPVLGRLAHSIARSHQSGAGLVDVLEGASRELRREHRRRVETAARGAGVKAVIPLAVCFLPAFFALGVVPIVASLASSTNFLGM